MYLRYGKKIWTAKENTQIAMYLRYGKTDLAHVKICHLEYLKMLKGGNVHIMQLDLITCTQRILICGEKTMYIYQWFQGITLPGWRTNNMYIISINIIFWSINYKLYIHIYNIICPPLPTHTYTSINKNSKEHYFKSCYK